MEVGAVYENKGHSLNLECCRSWKSSKSPIRLLSEVSGGDKGGRKVESTGGMHRGPSKQRQPKLRESRGASGQGGIWASCPPLPRSSASPSPCTTLWVSGILEFLVPKL